MVRESPTDLAKEAPADLAKEAPVDLAPSFPADPARAAPVDLAPADLAREVPVEKIKIWRAMDGYMTPVSDWHDGLVIVSSSYNENTSVMN